MGQIPILAKIVLDDSAKPLPSPDPSRPGAYSTAPAKIGTPRALRHPVAGIATHPPWPGDAPGDLTDLTELSMRSYPGLAKSAANRPTTPQPAPDPPPTRDRRYDRDPASPRKLSPAPNPAQPLMQARDRHSVKPRAEESVRSRSVREPGWRSPRPPTARKDEKPRHPTASREGYWALSSCPDAPDRSPRLSSTQRDSQIHNIRPRGSGRQQRASFGQIGPAIGPRQGFHRPGPTGGCRRSARCLHRAGPQSRISRRVLGVVVMPRCPGPFGPTAPPVKHAARQPNP